MEGSVEVPGNGAECGGGSDPEQFAFACLLPNNLRQQYNDLVVPERSTFRAIRAVRQAGA
jgi:hypothetical protein